MRPTRTLSAHLRPESAVRRALGAVTALFLLLAPATASLALDLDADESQGADSTVGDAGNGENPADSMNVLSESGESGSDFAEPLDLESAALGFAPMATSTSTDIWAVARTVAAPLGPTGLIGENFTSTEGATFQLYTFTTAEAGPQDPVNEPWATCTIASSGQCAIEVPDTNAGGANHGKQFWLIQVAAATGTYTSSHLTVGWSRDVLIDPATDISVNFPLLGFTAPLEPNTAQYLPQRFRTDDSRQAYWYNSFGAAAQSLNNPVNENYCEGGLNIALVLDMSSSIDAAEREEYYNALTGPTGIFAELMNTGAAVATFTFGTDSPAQGSSNYPEPLVVNAANMAALHARVQPPAYDASIAEYTNWDKVLRTVARSPYHYDAVLFVTDGLPNYMNGSLGYDATGHLSRPDDVTLRAVEAAVYSANAIKLKNTKLFAFGVGTVFDGEALRNLAVLAGPTVGFEVRRVPTWTEMGVQLRTLVTGLSCENLTVSVTRVAATHAWTIEKFIEGPEQVFVDPTQTSAEVDYRLRVSQAQPQFLDIWIEGQITVTNTLDGEGTVTDLQVEAAGATSCTLTSQPQPPVSIQPGARQIFEYQCAFDPAGGIPTGEMPVHAAITWTDTGGTGGEVEVEESMSWDDADIDYVDRTITVTDDRFEFDPAWTITWGDAADGIYERIYTTQYLLEDWLGDDECAQIVNTATATGELTDVSSAATVEICVEQPPAVAVEGFVVEPSMVRYLAWSITKSVVDNIDTIGPTDTASFPYTVTVTPQPSPAEYWLQGSLTLSNANTQTDQKVSLNVSIDDEAWECVPHQGFVMVPAAGSAPVMILCQRVAGHTPAMTGTITVIGQWAPDGEVTVLMSYDFNDGLEEHNRTVTITDDVWNDGKPPVTLGTATWNEAQTPTVFTYTTSYSDHSTTESRWYTYISEATIVETSQRAQAEVDYLVVVPGTQPPGPKPPGVKPPVSEPAPQPALPRTGAESSLLLTLALALALGGITMTTWARRYVRR